MKKTLSIFLVLFALSLMAQEGLYLEGKDSSNVPCSLSTSAGQMVVVHIENATFVFNNVNSLTTSHKAFMSRDKMDINLWKETNRSIFSSGRDVTLSFEQNGNELEGYQIELGSKIYSCSF